MVESGPRNAVFGGFAWIRAVSAGAFLLGGVALAETPPVIVQANNYSELSKKWCAADPGVDHIFILPADLFVDSCDVICDGDAYKFYRVIELDPDDFVSYVDPPFGRQGKRLGCDGKAGRETKNIALNRRPV